MFGSLCNQALASVPIGALHWENIHLPKTELKLNSLCVLPFHSDIKICLAGQVAELI